MPNEQDATERDLIAAAQGHLQAALTLVNSAARRLHAIRPDIGDDLFKLGAAVVASIRKMDAERLAPAATATTNPETPVCPQ